MNPVDLLKEYLDVCDLHLDRLKFSLSKIEKYYPFKENLFPLEDMQDLAYLEMFTNRFSKLQDTLGNKVFGLALDVLGNGSQNLTYIDRLNTLEKYTILESASKWRDLRNIRNELSHEYPNSYAKQSETLNKIMDSWKLLENVLIALKKELQKI
jgi:uncharacterized protein with HEPN domain